MQGLMDAGRRGSRAALILENESNRGKRNEQCYVNHLGIFLEKGLHNTVYKKEKRVHKSTFTCVTLVVWKQQSRGLARCIAFLQRIEKHRTSYRRSVLFSWVSIGVPRGYGPRYYRGPLDTRGWRRPYVFRILNKKKLAFRYA